MCKNMESQRINMDVIASKKLPVSEVKTILAGETKFNLRDIEEGDPVIYYVDDEKDEKFTKFCEKINQLFGTNLKFAVTDTVGDIMQKIKVEQGKE